MFRKILIANRGEIACRVLRTLDRMGIASVAVYADADRSAPHVCHAGEAVRIGPSPVAESYLNGAAVLDAAIATGAEAIHPGYGFLSENPDFAEACAARGIVFIGPTARHMRLFGLKHTARELAAAAHVPLAPGSGLVGSVAEALSEADRIGYPVMLKSTAGGGGIGLQLCRSADRMEELFGRVSRLARGNFGDASLFLEKLIERGRHIEVQIFGDGKGRVVALGERDCSVQRRNQKVIEETPAPHLDASTRQTLLATAVRLGESVGYANAGTVEFMFDVDTGQFYFLEVNTRLQVEHGITEAVTGIDLVEWMIRQAAGEDFDITSPAPSGAAIEVRLYAEDPARGFRPATGLLTEVRFPDDVRVDGWVETGTVVTAFYDPLLAKLVVGGRDRAEAVAALERALGAASLAGIETNLGYLQALIGTPDFQAGRMITRSLDGFAYTPRSIEVLAAGTQSTVQDYPGRLGYWAVGVPPSGPMDALSFRLANRAVGNAPDAAGLEFTMSGPTLRFASATTICLGGAVMAADLDGVAIEWWQPVPVAAGAVLRLGRLTGAGCRTYLAVAGGIDVPAYLGSRSTFTLGGFGGHGGRALLPGDVLRLGAHLAEAPRVVPVAVRPAIGDEWELGVLYGPHGAPDFFTPADIDRFFEAVWTVHYNSSRTGVRLIGPKPEWARTDGGEAGLHPSNIHDNAYAIGAVDFTGDMPVILGPDGPSLGGFVCPATVASGELWKLGQLRPGDRVRFRRLSAADAAGIAEDRERVIATLRPTSPRQVGLGAAEDAVLATRPPSGDAPLAVYRRSGDRNLLVEYGPLVLDIELRLRAHLLMQALEALAVPGIVDLTPGIRSLQVHYDDTILPSEKLLELLTEIEPTLPVLETISVPSRIVHLPLSWDDAATRLAIEKYMQSVRDDAPWCPSNIEFIRRINGLDSIDEVRRIVFEASYLVLGLGDVYLGAPVATPVDPRHRLVTTKYNPARTWTPENAVGIGGAYLCIYGMEGPGGYQFVGRTCQVWNAYKTNAAFMPGMPWLLRFFDQIKFFPVSHDELLDYRADFAAGRRHPVITPCEFSLADHRRFLARHEPAIVAAKTRQQHAFEAERARWAASGQIGHDADDPDLPAAADNDDLPDGCEGVSSPVAGNVWRLVADMDQIVQAGDLLVLVESMKMEIAVTAPIAGRVIALRCEVGRTVAAGQILVVLAPVGRL